MKNLQTVSLLLIPYLTICSGLYHLAYWGAFDINGLAYIGISDIIKSFIYPFLTAGLMIFIGILYSEFAFGIDKIFPSGDGRFSYIGIAVNSKVGLPIVLILWLVLVYGFYKFASTVSWFAFGFLVAAVPSTFLDRAGLFKSTFQSNTTRQQIIRLLIYIPAFSFAAGKYESDLVLQNINYQYTVNPTSRAYHDASLPDTLKLIGHTDQQYFFTDMRNRNIYILRGDKIDTLILCQSSHRSPANH